MNYIEVSVQEVATIIETQNPIIIDARDAHSYRDQHVEGAMLSHGDLVEHLIKSQDFERPVIVYCYHGISSKELAEVLARAGFKYTYSMIGGYTAWKKRSTLYSENPYSNEVTSWLEKEGFEKQALNSTIPGHITPLILACQQNNETAALELMAAGADVNLRDAEGNSALWAACHAGNINLIEDLIAAGANIDSKNNNAISALMFASTEGKSEVANKLLKLGATPA